MKSKLFYYYILGHIFVSMIIYYSNLQSKNIYNGFIFAILIGYCISMVNSYFLIYSYNVFEKKDLIFIIKKIFNKFVGPVIVLLQIISSFVTGLFLYIPLISVIGSNTMPLTNRSYIALFIIFIYLVAFKNTERTILYAIGFFALFSTVLVPLIFVLIGRELDTRLVLGAITHSLHKPLPMMIVSSIYFFNGIESLSVYNVALEKKSFKKAAMLYGFVGIPLSLVPIIVPIGTWGPYAIKNIVYPILATSDTVALDLFVIERVLYLMLPLYISLEILGSIAYFYVSYRLVKNSISSKKIKLLIYIASLALLLIIPNITTDFNSILTIATYWGYIWVVIICITSALIYLESKKWVKNQQ